MESKKKESLPAVAGGYKSDVYRKRFSVTENVWPVGADGRCTCPAHPNCKRPGKHADERAPKNEAYAVATGASDNRGSGVIVIDPDRKGGIDGVAQLEDLEKKIGALPTTFKVATPGDGAHVYVQHPGCRVNGKLDTAIDLKGDRRTDETGFVYVVGPGSPGYVKTDDPCVVRPGEPYEVTNDAPIAALPDAWIAHLLERNCKPREGCFAPEPIDVKTDEGRRRIALAVEACKTFAPSRADGQGGAALLRVCIHLVRKLELPLDVARDLILEHFNPRCTQADGVTRYEWSADEIEHKLLDARDKSAAPCGILSEKTEEGIAALRARLSNPNRTPVPPTESEARIKVGAGEAYDGERVKVTTAALTQMLYAWPDWKGVFWWDVLGRRMVAISPPTAGKMTLEEGKMSKGDLAQIKHWLDVHGFLASKEMIEDALWTVVREPDRQKNAIAEYLDSVAPDDASGGVLDTLATDVFGCTDAFANVLLKKTLVAAARRGRCPGTFHKSMLVLKGKQGCGKTPAVKILAGDLYHSTGNGNLAERDTLLQCQGKWLVEVEELSALSKADSNALKTAISRTHDTITKKYEPDDQVYARSFVLIGTTNKQSFLTDSTGHDRYWVIECGQIDLARLEQLRDQIWAEADALARAAYSTELDGEQKATLAETNKVYEKDLPLMPKISEVVRQELRSERTKKTGKVQIEIQFLWDSMQMGQPAPSVSEAMQIEECLTLHAFSKKTKGKGLSAPRLPKKGGGITRPHSWWEADAQALAAKFDEDEHPASTSTASAAAN